MPHPCLEPENRDGDGKAGARAGSADIFHIKDELEAWQPCTPHVGNRQDTKQTDHADIF